jgi:septal ring factor EnvC (AmiA/AmiB activator)
MIIMSRCKPMQQTGDSAARKVKLVELEQEQERLLKEEKRVEEVEAREWEAAASREREAAAEANASVSSGMHGRRPSWRPGRARHRRHHGVGWGHLHLGA